MYRDDDSWCRHVGDHAFEVEGKELVGVVRRLVRGLDQPDATALTEEQQSDRAVGQVGAGRAPDRGEGRAADGHLMSLRER